MTTKISNSADELTDLERSFVNSLYYCGPEYEYLRGALDVLDRTADAGTRAIFEAFRRALDRINAQSDDIRHLIDLRHADAAKFRLAIREKNKTIRELRARLKTAKVNAKPTKEETQ